MSSKASNKIIVVLEVTGLGVVDMDWEGKIDIGLEENVDLTVDKDFSVDFSTESVDLGMIRMEVCVRDEGWEIVDFSVGAVDLGIMRMGLLVVVEGLTIFVVDGLGREDMEDLVTFSVVVGSGPEAVGFVLQLSVEQLKLGQSD